MKGFDRMIGPLQRRVQLMIGRAVIAAVNDGAQIQAVQVDMLADETHDEVERFQSYGHSSVPLAGAEALVVFVGGLRSHGVAIVVDDRRYRPRDLEPGESALYDDQGQTIEIRRDGIRIKAAGKTVQVEAQSVTVTADHVSVDAGSIELGGAGGLGVARIGDAVAGGVITGGSTKVTAS